MNVRFPPATTSRRAMVVAAIALAVTIHALPTMAWAEPPANSFATLNNRNLLGEGQKVELTLLAPGTAAPMKMTSTVLRLDNAVVVLDVPASLSLTSYGLSTEWSDDLPDSI